MMPTLSSEVHFWTLQSDVVVKPNRYGSFKYYCKSTDGETGDSCYQSKKKYCELRGFFWDIPNKRPEKLRDKLKELEDYLFNNKIVCFSWCNNQLQLLLSTGILASVKINKNTGDINSITFDKQLAAKLQVNILCDGIIFGRQIVCICNDGHVLGYGGYWKEAWIVEGGPRRHLNFFRDWLAVWGKTEAEHPQPWSPLGRDYQRANLHLYRIGPRGPELLAYKKTDGDPIDVLVSRKSDKTLIIIEQKVTSWGAVSLEISNLDLIGINLKTVSVISVPLQTQASCCALNNREDKLFIGCIDGSLALLNRNTGLTKTVKALFIPKMAKWHAQDALFVISNEKGQLQYFDSALNTVKIQDLMDNSVPSDLIDLSGYFRSQFMLSSMHWETKYLILAFEQGPIVLISHKETSLTFRSIAQRYLKMSEVEKTIRLLLSWQFDADVFFVLQKVVIYLLSKPMNDEVGKFLQDALGSYHNPTVPLICEVQNRFASQVFSLTRRFFHHLVRANMFETAFLLAVDLGHHDLFMDLHYIAVKIGEKEMAAAARAQASAILSRCSSASSNCSRSSCSQCSQSSSSGNSEFLLAKDTSESINEYSNRFNKLPHKMSNINNISQSTPSCSMKSTYVKAPEVPINFSKPPKNTQLLSFTPPLPNLYDLGNAPHSVTSSNIQNNVYTSTDGFSMKVAQETTHSQQLTSNPRCSEVAIYSGSVRKAQSKVQFSDTVTAFIVPEIKRPVRITAPPSHLTNPQKELADSLPLCHPNEDYLKDFAPIRKSNENRSENVASQPKIKVVHFGVV